MTTIGYHIGKTHIPGIKNTRNCIEINMEYFLRHIHDTSVMQMFIAGPRSTKINFSKEEIESLKQYIEIHNLFIICHGNYMDRLCSSSVPKPYVESVVNKELEVCQTIGIRAFVLHIRDQSPVITYKKIKKLHPGNVKIYIENEAMVSNSETYNTPENIIKILNIIPEVGFCIDIAHLHASGVGLESYNDAKDFFEAIISKINPDRLMIHLNDNITAMGCGKDEHAVLMEGKIWQEYKYNMMESGLAYIIHFIDRYSIPAVLELHGDPVSTKSAMNVVDMIRHKK